MWFTPFRLLILFVLFFFSFLASLCHCYFSTCLRAYRVALAVAHCPLLSCFCCLSSTPYLMFVVNLPPFLAWFSIFLFSRHHFPHFRCFFPSLRFSFTPYLFPLVFCLFWFLFQLTLSPIMLFSLHFLVSFFFHPFWCLNFIFLPFHLPFVSRLHSPLPFFLPFPSLIPLSFFLVHVHFAFSLPLLQVTSSLSSLLRDKLIVFLI